MQKNNTILIIIIALILFLPSNSAKSDVVKTWIDNIDKYDLSSNEGYVAYHINSFSVIDKPDDVVNKCECNGTGKIRTGDNRILPCPCDNCTCSKTTESIELTIKDSPTEEVQKKNTDTISEETDIQSLGTRCILFTNAEWCLPCRQLEKTTLKELKNAGFKFGGLKDDDIHIIVLDEESPLFEKYGKGTIPMFIFIKDGKIVKELTGYYTSKVIADEINKNLKNE